MYGEIVEFENGVRGLVQNIEMKTIGVVLLGSVFIFLQTYLLVFLLVQMY